MRLKNSAGLAALCAGLLMAGAVSAQTYGRLVVFGDSLSDNGNLYAATGTPTSPPYFQGRYSNGPVFTELLGFNLARVGGSVAGSIDYAYGGARTDTGTLPPSLRAQVNNYIAAGGTFTANTLVSLYGGANNLLQGIGPASVSADPFGTINATAAAAAADMGFLINQVTTAGAGTVLVSNLPNLAQTPQFNSGPGLAAQGLANSATTVFNTALFAQAQAQAAAHPNSNIIFFDVFRAAETIRNSPGRFGFTNVTQTCLVGATACTTPDTYLFWDTVHPTAAGHRLLAQVANTYLYYGNDGAASTVQGEQAVRHRSDSLDAAMDMASHRGGGEEGISLGGWIGRDQTTYDARGLAASADIDTNTLGFSFQGRTASGLRLGVAIAGDQSEVTTGASAFNADSVGLDAFAGWSNDSWFVSAAVGGSHDRYSDIARQTPVAQIRTAADTSGSSYGAKLQAGLWFDMGGISVSPRAALGYVKSNVDGYTETGDMVALLQYADREITATTGEVAVKFESDFGQSTKVWLDVGYRDSFSYDDDGVNVRIAGNTARPIVTQYEDPEGSQALVGLGVSARVWGNWSLGVGYRGRFGDGSDSQAGRIGLSMDF